MKFFAGLRDGRPGVASTRRSAAGLALNLKNITDRKYCTSAHGSADILILPGPPRELQLPPRAKF
jgi:outer membrane receptor for Fe3+-dicitrate